MSYKGQETDAFGNIPPPPKKVVIFKKVSKYQKSITFKIIQVSKVYKLKHHNFFQFSENNLDIYLPGNMSI